MIASGLFPTNETNIQGYSITDSILNLNLGSAINNPLNPYAMGYINYENFPRFFNVSSIEYEYDENGIANKLKVTSATKKENHAWGYIGDKRNSTNTNYYTLYSKIYNDGSQWVAKAIGLTSNPNNSNLFLINSGYLANYTNCNAVGIIGAYCTKSDDGFISGQDLHFSSIFFTESSKNTINELLSFKKGEIPIIFRINGINYSVNYSDFNENNVAIIRNNSNTADLYLAITNINVYFYGRAQNGTPVFHIKPFIKSETIEGNVYYDCGCIMDNSYSVRVTDGFGRLGIKISDEYRNPLKMGDYYFLKGVEFECSYDETTTWIKDSNLAEYDENKNIFRRYLGYTTTEGYQWEIIQPLSLSQISTYAELSLKYINSYLDSIPPSRYDYGEYVLTNKYNESDMPLGEILIGEYDEILDDLRLWQRLNIDITANTFDPATIPDYDGGGGGGDDDTEEEGDRISPQFRQIGTASNFITQYGMTAEQVALFGKLLWTSWADSEGASTGFWKNFFLTLSPNQDTGSYSLSDVIQFIVSLRVYPFSLTNLYYTSSSGSQNVFIGRGEEGLACGGGINLLSIGSAVDYIQCGSVTVPKTFNDFRDYENTAITAYLPYCGTVELSPGDVIGKTLNCHYAIDMQSGQCTAFITSSDDSGVLYPVAQKDGEIGFMIPLTATNSGQLASQKMQDAKNIAETIGGVFWNNVTAGARMVGNITNSKGGVSTGGMIGGIASGIYGTVENVVGGLSDLAQQSIDRLNRSAIDCPSLSGGTGFASFGTPATAYIQIRHGIYKQPENYAHTQGRVTTKSGTLSSFSGFTKCINPDLSGLSCTVAEKSEIKKLLESGVYI